VSRSLKSLYIPSKVNIQKEIIRTFCHASDKKLLKKSLFVAPGNDYPRNVIQRLAEIYNIQVIQKKDNIATQIGYKSLTEADFVEEQVEPMCKAEMIIKQNEENLRKNKQAKNQV
jgi:energy-converting hydrogenase A subunit M